MNDQGIITSKRIIRLFTLALLLLSFMIIPGPSAQAKKKYKGWVQKTNGRIYYYEASGRKARSKRKLLGRKLYYFDANGRQHVGWIKIKDHYCYYNLERGKNGFLVKNKTVNGIKIDGNGYAVDNLDKVRLLAEANRIAFNLTNFNMTLREKNKACFLYIKDNTNWRNLKGFRTENKDWDMFYAEYALFKNTGDCYSGGCAFAYMAAAVGNENVYALDLWPPRSHGKDDCMVHALFLPLLSDRGGETVVEVPDSVIEIGDSLHCLCGNGLRIDMAMRIYNSHQL